MSKRLQTVAFALSLNILAALPAAALATPPNTPTELTTAATSTSAPEPATMGLLGLGLAGLALIGRRRSKK